jgi:hypothetical protein
MRRVINGGMLLAPAALVGILLGGCGGAPGADDEKARGAIRMVGVEYGRYLSANNGAPPPDEAALTAFIDEQIKRTPDYGVKSADELLTLTRDGERLQVIVGKKVAPPDAPEPLWAAYEKAGVGGQRLVVNARGSIIELSAEEVDRAVSK